MNLGKPSCPRRLLQRLVRRLDYTRRQLAQRPGLRKMSSLATSPMMPDQCRELAQRLRELAVERLEGRVTGRVPGQPGDVGRLVALGEREDELVAGEVAVTRHQPNNRRVFGEQIVHR